MTPWQILFTGFTVGSFVGLLIFVVWALRVTRNGGVMLFR